MIKKRLLQGIVLVFLILTLLFLAVQNGFLSAFYEGFLNVRTNESTEEKAPPVTVKEVEKSTLVKAKVKGEITVEWYEHLIPVDSAPFLAKITEFDETFETLEEFKNSVEFYEAGVVESDLFKGYRYMIFTFPDWFGMAAFERFVYNKDTDELILIDKEARLTSEYAIFSSVADLTVQGVTDIPKSFEYNGVEYVFNFDTFEANTYSIPEEYFAFEFNGSRFFKSDEGCMYVRLADNVIAYYTPHLSFIKKGEDEYLGPGSSLNVSLDDGTDISEEGYTYQQMGCGGFRSCYKIVKDDISGQLETVGTTSSDEKIYAYKDDYLTEVDAKISELKLYGGSLGEENDVENFNKKYLILFYQNEFGQLIEFTNQRLIPPVECGKPVLYLYPPEEIDVSVNVYPRGGVTISEPDYKDGWYVRAFPDGKIYNYSDGEVYTSLFWESESHGQYMAQQGFLISDEDKANQLNEILTRYGFNEVEKNEFLEYWVKKLQGSEYYFASLLPQPQLDEIARLVIKPKPNRVYRLFFNFYPVAEGYVYKEPIVRPIKRDNGFTVVEWGGSY